MFAMIIEEVFEIKGRGIVLSGHFDSERYSVCENTCLYDMFGNEYVVSGIAVIGCSVEQYSAPKNYRIDLIFDIVNIALHILLKNFEQQCDGINIHAA